MPTNKQLKLAIKILGFLIENYSRGLTLEELDRLYVKDSYTSIGELREILDGLITDNLVEKRFVESSSNPNSKSLIMYHITSEGSSKYYALKADFAQARRARAPQTEYVSEEKQQIKDRNRILIWCSIGFVVVVAIIIIVAISLG